MAEPSPSFEFNQPTVVALCYVASMVFGLPLIIGLILAYVWKGSPGGDWEISHFRFHIRTFWLGLLLGVLALVPTLLTLTLAGFILYPLLAVWFLVRSIKALLAAQRRDPVANIQTWVW